MMYFVMPEQNIITTYMLIQSLLQLKFLPNSSIKISLLNEWCSLLKSHRYFLSHCNWADSKTTVIIRK